MAKGLLWFTSKCLQGFAPSALKDERGPGQPLGAWPLVIGRSWATAWRTCRLGSGPRRSDFFAVLPQIWLYGCVCVCVCWFRARKMTLSSCLLASLERKKERKRCRAKNKPPILPLKLTPARGELQLAEMTGRKNCVFSI